MPQLPVQAVAVHPAAVQNAVALLRKAVHPSATFEAVEQAIGMLLAGEPLPVVDNGSLTPQPPLPDDTGEGEQAELPSPLLGGRGAGGEGGVDA